MADLDYACEKLQQAIGLFAKHGSLQERLAQVADQFNFLSRGDLSSEDQREAYDSIHEKLQSGAAMGDADAEQVAAMIVDLAEQVQLARFTMATH